MINSRFLLLFSLTFSSLYVQSQSHLIIQLGSGKEIGYNNSQLQKDLSNLFQDDVTFGYNNYFLPSFDLIHIKNDVFLKGLSFNGTQKSWPADGSFTNEKGIEQHYIIVGNYNMYGGIKLGFGFYPLNAEPDAERYLDGIMQYFTYGLAKNGMKLYNRSDEPIQHKEITLEPWTYNEYTTVKHYMGLGIMFYHGIACFDFTANRFFNSTWFNQAGERTPSFSNGGHWLFALNIKIAGPIALKEK